MFIVIEASLKLIVIIMLSWSLSLPYIAAGTFKVGQLVLWLAESVRLA